MSDADTPPPPSEGRLRRWRRRSDDAATIAENIKRIGIAVGAVILAGLAILGINLRGGDDSPPGATAASGTAGTAAIDIGDKPSQQNVLLATYYDEILGVAPASGLSEGDLAANGDVYNVALKYTGFGESSCRVRWSLLSGSRALLPYPSRYPRSLDCPRGAVPRFEPEIWVPIPECVHSYFVRVVLADDVAPRQTDESEPIVLAGPDC